MLIAERGTVLASGQSYPSGMTVEDSAGSLGALLEADPRVRLVGDTAEQDGSVACTTYTVTLGSRFSGSRNYFYFSSSAVDRGYYFYAFNFTNPPQAVTVIQNKPQAPLGFGSRHPGAMNMLMCDGSVRRYPYGRPGLGHLITRNDGQVSDVPD
jgi:prepilin-type processing-associated H-X9-DG protein